MFTTGEVVASWFLTHAAHPPLLSSDIYLLVLHRTMVWSSYRCTVHMVLSKTTGKHARKHTLAHKNTITYIRYSNRFTGEKGKTGR